MPDGSGFRGRLRTGALNEGIGRLANAWTSGSSDCDADPAPSDPGGPAQVTATRRLRTGSWHRKAASGIDGTQRTPRNICQKRTPVAALGKAAAQLSSLERDV
jgi:hypothetical protein